MDSDKRESLVSLALSLSGSLSASGAPRASGHPASV